MVANQRAPGFNRGMSSNFWWLTSAKHVKFTEECVICTKKDVCHYNTVKKTVHRVETHSQVKKKF